MRGAAPHSIAGFTWTQIFRLALVQNAIGAMVVLTTSTMNRIMVVELGLAAMVPGALVALHYAVQMLRPRFGHGADRGRSRTRWIVGGLAILALGTVLASVATGLAVSDRLLGLSLASFAFVLIGIGVGASGTNLLALVAAGVAPHRRGPAATLMWTLMIAGFALTAGIAGSFLDPFSAGRLVAVTAATAGLALAVGTLATLGIERSICQETSPKRHDAVNGNFSATMRDVWQESATRRFTVFVFISMLAYSAQDLVLEPFAGLIFAMTPGETTQLAGMQHGGTFLGMIVVALAGFLFARRHPGLLRLLCVTGCLGSALAFAALFAASRTGGEFPLVPTVATLGFFNGLFAVAAIGSMMGLASGTGADESPRHGIRMGLWGAAQAIAFALGGFAGTALVDVTLHFTGSNANAYGGVFLIEGVGFVVSALLAWRCIENRFEFGERARPMANNLSGAAA
ncbi:PUCC protein [Fulvimarina pelagi HTCC2506]|uniref:PUCC protein n=1 Tax=Fulvimarina pelagi HTCC2506 TaxID=314231 RepID=Q0FYR0_9HYPH|nr:BCD family MFS transporter [Fulvimarina pelagi]EAU40248.1 PUCC protein [Fulvimarina pelagi HTCC2506]